MTLRKIFIGLFIMLSFPHLAGCETMAHKYYSYKSVAIEGSNERLSVYVESTYKHVSSGTTVNSDPYTVHISYFSKEKPGKKISINLEKLTLSNQEVLKSNEQYNGKMVYASNKTGFSSKYSVEIPLLFTNHKPMSLNLSIVFGDKVLKKTVQLKPVYSEKESNPILDGIRREYW